VVVLAQSKRSWFSLEFEAACLEAKRKIEGESLRYTIEDKMRYIQSQVCSVPRFAKESGEHTFPSWETIVKWEKENPDLPTQVRERGFLGGFRAQQFTGLARVSEERIPVHSTGYSPQSQPYVSGNDILSQFCGAMSQVLVVGMVTWFAGQCVKAAKS